MRLLHVNTLEITEFVGEDVPEYVILSHTWEDEEVSMEDIRSGAYRAKKGYNKIYQCCRKAGADGFSYCWIDTCCIDKTSSVELSEAINSMYRYYKDSCVCYAYLADCGGSQSSPVMESRWWTRGWTLQELIAPAVVEFYDAQWEELGTKLSLGKQIAKHIGIDEGILLGENPLSRNVAVRMSWAAGRKTTRIEDRAYSLMGIFGISMPLLYGEGNRAFRRLQEEILKIEEDYTLFAWTPSVSYHSREQTATTQGLLADSPSEFFNVKNLWARSAISDLGVGLDLDFRHLSKNCHSLKKPPKDHSPPFLTSRGLKINLLMLQKTFWQYDACIAVVSAPQGQKLLLCTSLYSSDPKTELYSRHSGESLRLMSKDLCKQFVYRSIYVTQSPPSMPPNKSHEGRFHDLAVDHETGLILVDVKSKEGKTLKCLTSSWISMGLVLAHKLGTGGDSEALNSVRQAYEVADSVQRAHFDEITRRASDIDQGELLTLAWGRPIDCCWFTAGERTRSLWTANVHHFIFFHDEKRPGSTLLVQIKLGDEHPLCNVMQASLEEAHSRTIHTPLEGEILDSDRATIITKQTPTDEEVVLPDLKTTVSIRRMAAVHRGINKFKRFSLTITQETLPISRA